MGASRLHLGFKQAESVSQMNISELSKQTGSAHHEKW
jgi:hypothetical protein